jgi:hypothetical protein
MQLPPMATMLPRYCRGDGFERYGAKFSAVDRNDEVGLAGAERGIV